jgi:hypothetical protein
MIVTNVGSENWFHDDGYANASFLPTDKSTILTDERSSEEAKSYNKNKLLSPFLTAVSCFDMLRLCTIDALVLHRGFLKTIPIALIFTFIHRQVFLVQGTVHRHQ